MHTAISIAVVIAIIIFFKRGQTARAIKRAADRTTWGAASDTRFPRIPKGTTLLGRKKGLK
jgi:hypothetical protein